MMAERFDTRLDIAESEDVDTLSRDVRFDEDAGFDEDVSFDEVVSEDVEE